MIQAATADWADYPAFTAPTPARKRFPAAAGVAKMSAKTTSAATVNTDTVDYSALVQAVAQGRDRDAFGRLFAHYAPRLKSFLLRQGADDASAEDLAQEAMLTVWRKAGLFDASKSSAGTWIFTIARNLRIDAVRKARRPEFDAEDPAFVTEAEPAADQAFDAEQTGARVRAALAELPEEQATVVRLSFFEDKPHAEIAEKLALPLGTVKSRLRLAMKRIRTCLGDER